MAELMLPRMLIGVQASDAPLFTLRHRAMLNVYLDSKRLGATSIVSECMLAILKAYEQVGDSEAVPVVERLANGEGYAKRDKAIQQAAQNCLPFLYERGENETQRQTLLRASQPAANAPVTLLRPASAAPATAPNQLLRPASSETTPD